MFDELKQGINCFVSTCDCTNNNSCDYTSELNKKYFEYNEYKDDETKDYLRYFDMRKIVKHTILCETILHETSSYRKIKEILNSDENKDGKIIKIVMDRIKLPELRIIRQELLLEAGWNTERHEQVIGRCLRK